MSKSNAWKKRRKMEREGRRNPEWNRSDFALMDLRSRKTKTKKEKLNQQKHKGRLSDRNYDHDNGLLYLGLKIFCKIHSLFAGNPQASSLTCTRCDGFDVPYRTW
ncbi:hypothetical protein [Bacillus sp. Marseille-Q3570]|uniref:hypothetical protein n=1 Tax=Bacillus sp. Marseille-Q3570 TaxID=2963522 RepID=UPI0021B6F773|nr:hypothetical protein [Bacillus sp. Marseille-Q3570]